MNVRLHVAADQPTGTWPLLTLSPSSARKAQKDNDDRIVNPPSAKKRGAAR
jgi:hypothetical protein